jgi:DNA replicative helicase MCM subunit Mcm2 (Cdc46/Mcm family)
MAQASNQELTDRLIEFYRNYYRDEIGELAQQYPNEKRSLYVDYEDLYQFDADLAEDYLSQPTQLREYAEEALRLYDLPADVKLGNAHVRLVNLPDTVESISVHDNHIGKLIAIKGIIAEADDEDIKITDSAFECQRCGTMNYIPQQSGEYQEPHECQGCERKGPFRINFDQSEFIDSQQFTIRSTETDLAEGTEPLEINVRVEDDLVGVSAGDYVTVTGIVHIDQQDADKQLFELYIEGVSITPVDDSSPSFDSPKREAMDMETFLSVASDTLASLPDTTREPGTKAKLITPFIEALGWDKFDNDECRFEYTDSKTTKRVDYALFASDSESPAVLVEAKQLGTRLGEHESQIYDYLRIFSAEYGLLTNGESYRVYCNPSENAPEKVTELELHDIPDAGIMDKLRPSAFSSETNSDDTAKDPESESHRDSSESEPSVGEQPTEVDIDSESEEPIIDLIDQMDDDRENGVPIEKIVEIATEEGMDESTVMDIIEQRRQQGRIYSPTDNYLRTT